MLYYIRDEEGSLIGFKYNDITYYYIKNMQEDIIGITDSNYNLLCSYEYDSWGKLISIKDNNNAIITDTSHIGYINPFRYRSYYYDNETKLYYLNSRYYNPEWGRFINCDSYLFDSTLNCNMFLYNENNPINNLDNDGQFFKKAWNWIKQKTAKYIVPIIDSVRKIVTNKKNQVSKIISVKTYVNNPSPKPTTVQGITSSIETGTKNISSLGDDKPITVYSNPTEKSSGIELNIFNIQISFNKSITDFSGSIGMNLNNKYYGITLGFNNSNARIYGELNSTVTEKNISTTWYLRGDFSIFYLVPIKIPVINPQIFPLKSF